MEHSLTGLCVDSSSNIVSLLWLSSEFSSSSLISSTRSPDVRWSPDVRCSGNNSDDCCNRVLSPSSLSGDRLTESSAVSAGGCSIAELCSLAVLSSVLMDASLSCAKRSVSSHDHYHYCVYLHQWGSCVLLHQLPDWIYFVLLDL